MINVEAVADKADMIVDGYAFTKAGNAVRVLTLERKHMKLSLQLVFLHEGVELVRFLW